MKYLWDIWRKKSLDIFLGIVGFVVGAVIHNSLYTPFKIFGIESYYFVGFLFALAAITIKECLGIRKK